MNNLELVRRKALEYKFINEDSQLQISNRKDKKYKIKSLKSSDPNKYIHFGAKGMEDYTIHHDEKRRLSFYNRFKNNKSFNNPNSGLYYSRYLLW